MYMVQHFRAFAYHHDEIPAFHAGYLVLTLLAAALLNLGFFAMLILIHMTLDLVKYREYHRCSWRMTGRGMVKESLSDVTLLFIGLFFAVYFHHAAGVAGLSGLLRAEATLVGAVGTIVPKMQILQHFLRVMARLRHYLEFLHPGLHTEWTGVERISMFFLAVSLLLVAMAPLMLGLDAAAFQGILADQLVPWHL